MTGMRATFLGRVSVPPTVLEVSMSPVATAAIDIRLLALLLLLVLGAKNTVPREDIQVNTHLLSRLDERAPVEYIMACPHGHKAS